MTTGLRTAVLKSEERQSKTALGESLPNRGEHAWGLLLDGVKAGPGGRLSRQPQ